MHPWVLRGVPMGQGCGVLGCGGAAAQRGVEEGACPGNAGSLRAAAASSPSLYSKEILLFSL